MNAILNRKIKKGAVIVIRYEGPKGGPGMREMLAPTSCNNGARPRIRCCTHNRWTIFRRNSWFCCRSYNPEAFDGGPIALIKNGDLIKIDSKTKTLEIAVSISELKKRKKKWKQPTRSHLSGAIYKYSLLVSSASHGAITDKGK